MQGVREDVTVCPAEVTVRAATCPVSTGRELVGEVVEGGEGITAWQYVCRAFCPQTGAARFLICPLCIKLLRRGDGV